MTTKKQIIANRQNALKSTGPRTYRGKSVSRRNALSHGLTAEVIVIHGEHAELFDTMRERLHSEFGPRGPTEESLVEHLAGLLWRLRRVPMLEAGLFELMRHRTLEEDAKKAGPLSLETLDFIGVEPPKHTANADVYEAGRVMEGLTRNGDVLSKLGRHEAHLVRQVEQTLAELRRLMAEHAQDMSSGDEAG